MALTITISSTRSISVSGRLVAGETADIIISGVTPSALYLMNTDREVVAACEDFETEDSTGTGSMNLATTGIEAIVEEMPAGRAVNLSAIVQDSDGAIVGYGFLPVVAAPMPDVLEDVDTDFYIKASDIRSLFADVPTEYSNQRSLSEALAQVVGILQNLGLCLLAFLATATAWATEWQDVPADTTLGSGLTLTNGTISAAGGLDASTVTNVAEAVAATKADVLHGEGPVLITSNYITNNVRGNLVGEVWVPNWDGVKEWSGLQSIGDKIEADIAAATNGIGTAAYADRSDFATAADEAVLYQLMVGSNVVAEVTNYNSRTKSPQLRLLQLDDNKQYFTVWAETNGLSRIARAATNYTDSAIETAGANYAPKAWSGVTSGLGATAPSNTTWISTATTVIAGGYEYAKVVTTAGEAWVLCSNGLGLGGDTNAYFNVSTSDGETVFSIERTESQLIGVDADSISVSGGTVTIPVSVVSSEAPVCYATTDLAGGTWTDLTESTPAWISSASVTGSSGAWVWTIESTASAAFFHFAALQEGSTVIRNNAWTDLSQGIIVNGVKYVPVVSGTTLTWQAQ